MEKITYSVLSVTSVGKTDCETSNAFTDFSWWSWVLWERPASPWSVFRGVFVTDAQWCVAAFGHCHLKVNRKTHHLDFPVDLRVYPAAPKPQRCCLSLAAVSELVLLSRAAAWHATGCLCLVGLRRTNKSFYGIQDQVWNYTNFIFPLSVLSDWSTAVEDRRLQFSSSPREIF